MYPFLVTIKYRKMSAKSYFFTILVLFSVVATLKNVNSSEEIIEDKEEEVVEVVQVVEAPPTPPPKKGPKLNSKQVLMMNQILASYALSTIENPLCKNHTEKYKEAMRTLEPWAIQMFDASSKLQPGLLVGNTGEFGSFEQCLHIYAPTEYGPIRGQMCTIKILPGPNLTRSILRIRKLPLSSFNQIMETLKFDTLWSVCLPDSCPPSDVERHFNRTLQGIAEGLDFNVTLAEDGCVSYKSAKPLTKIQWLVILFLGGLLLFVIICTGYDILMTIYEDDATNQALLIFSAYSNAKIIFSDQSESADLDCLNGIRSLSMLWVLLGHRYLTTMFVPIVNGLDIFNWMQTLSSTSVVGASVSVDTFFMVSGLLVSYLFFAAMNKGVTFNLPLFYIHRYMRVTPVLGVIVLIYATVLELTGSGPVWNSIISSLRDPCANYWWSCLLHVQNYFNADELCVVQTWYLTCDMQYYFFSPVVLYPMWKWPHFGMLVLFLSLVITLGLNFDLAWIYQFNGSTPVTNELLKTKYFTHHYTTPYTRASPYLLGILLGYILYNTRGKKFKFNPAVSFVGWTVSIITFLLVVGGSLRFQKLEHPYNRIESTVYLTAARPAWTISLSWLIFNCVHGTGGIINAILSAYVFKVLAKLSYCMFLTHMIVMFGISGAEKTTYYFSNLTMWYMTFGDFAFTCVTSFLLAVCVELPIIRIDGALRKKAAKRKVEAK